MFIKFCGFTRREDIESAAWFPVSAVGFIFHSASARYVDPEKARCLAADLPLPLKKVGVFVDHAPDEIKRIAGTVNLDMLQVYRSEQAAALKDFLPFIRVYRITGREDLKAVEPPTGSSFILLDSYDRMHAGGTGKRFNWDILHDFPYMERTIIAGGINEETLPHLLHRFSPGGIDLSSGIESAPGIKSVSKMETIMTIIEEHRHATTAR